MYKFIKSIFLNTGLHNIANLLQNLYKEQQGQIDNNKK